MAKRLPKKSTPSVILPVTVTRIELQVFIHKDDAWVNADDLLKALSGIMVMEGNPYTALEKVLDSIKDARDRFKKENG